MSNTPDNSINLTQIENKGASLIDFPTPFPVKVMGKDEEGFVHSITKLAKEFDPSYDASTVELRPSSNGTYLSVTVTILATSQEQLDNFYRALTSNPKIKYVL